MSRIIQVYDEEKQSNVQVSCFVTHTDGGLGQVRWRPSHLTLCSNSPLFCSSSSLILLGLSVPFLLPPSLSPFLSSLSQADSEVAEAGKAVSLYFEEKLAAIYPDQSFPVEPEKRSRDENTAEEAAEESDDDFVQPKRKRLKPEEKPVHIKWRGSGSRTSELQNQCFLVFLTISLSCILTHAGLDRIQSTRSCPAYYRRFIVNKYELWNTSLKEFLFPFFFCFFLERCHQMSLDFVSSLCLIRGCWQGLKKKTCI